MFNRIELTHYSKYGITKHKVCDNVAQGMQWDNVAQGLG